MKATYSALKRKYTIYYNPQRKKRKGKEKRKPLLVFVVARLERELFFLLSSRDVSKQVSTGDTAVHFHSCIFDPLYRIETN